MNHDYAHCADFTEKCPRDCFRAQLERDLKKNRPAYIGMTFSYAMLKGTAECPKKGEAHGISDERQTGK